MPAPSQQQTRSKLASESGIPASISSHSWGLYFLALGLLSATFGKVLIDLFRLSTANSLYSHIPLIPLISVYLIWLKRDRASASGETGLTTTVGPLRFLAFVPLAFAGLAFASYTFSAPTWKADPANSLSLLTLAYVGCVWSLSIAVLGVSMFRRFLFPFAFLIFLAPFPIVVTTAIEVFFQHASAEVAALMISASQTPMLREGLFFKLPGITIQVAEECSGIRSTLVLLITSLVGGYMFFDRVGPRTLLAAAIVPIAILRNGLRIFTIAWLCVHVDTAMIDSAIHRRGGPLFFALSLIPLFALMFWLLRRETKRKTPSLSK